MKTAMVLNLRQADLILYDIVTVDLRLD